MQRGKILDRDWSKVLAVAASVLLTAMLVLTFAQAGRIRLLNARVSAIYQKAFYETCELMEGMSANFRKLLVTGSGQQQQILLNEISRQAQGAQDNLATLPLGDEAVSATIKFVNQAGDFATSLSSKLAGEGTISEEDYDTISTLSTSAADLSIGLGQLLTRYENGEDVFAGDYVSSGDESLYPLTNPAGEYPVLLYDGPFSDGAQGGTFLALEGLSSVTPEEAAKRLTAFMGTQLENLSLDGESQIPVDCYDFSFSANGYSLTAGVTKQGGEILYLLPNDDVTAIQLTDQEAVERARAFLISRGFGQMEMSYYSRFDGILTANFAATENNVVLYPDLIKVQISLADGQVIGLEAGNYLRNHVQRDLKLPALTQEEAVSRLSGRLVSQSVRLCVIPENTREVLCYEIHATDGANEYLVYIDAATGQEREIMQIISEENGTLVM